jgi:hypothetical protein
MRPGFTIPFSLCSVCGALPPEELHLKLKLVKEQKTREFRRTSAVTLRSITVTLALGKQFTGTS